MAYRVIEWGTSPFPVNSVLPKIFTFVGLGDSNTQHLQFATIASTRGLLEIQGAHPPPLPRRFTPKENKAGYLRDYEAHHHSLQKGRLFPGKVGIVGGWAP